MVFDLFAACRGIVPVTRDELIPVGDFFDEQDEDFGGDVGDEEYDDLDSAKNFSDIDDEDDDECDDRGWFQKLFFEPKITSTKCKKAVTHLQGIRQQILSDRGSSASSSSWSSSGLSRASTILSSWWGNDGIESFELTTQDLYDDWKSSTFNVPMKYRGYGSPQAQKRQDQQNDDKAAALSLVNLKQKLNSVQLFPRMAHMKDNDVKPDFPPRHELSNNGVAHFARASGSTKFYLVISAPDGLTEDMIEESNTLWSMMQATLKSSSGTSDESKT